MGSQSVRSAVCPPFPPIAPRAHEQTGTSRVGVLASDWALPEEAAPCVLGGLAMLGDGGGSSQQIAFPAASSSLPTPIFPTFLAFNLRGTDFVQ